MRKTQRIIASLAAVGALAVGSFAAAAPLPEDASKDPQSGAALTATPAIGAPASPRLEHRLARFEAMARTLTLKDDAQKSAWKHYVDARLALDGPRGDRRGKLEIDQQDRLEREARDLETRAEAVKKIAAARAALLETLSPEQKYVLERMEAPKPRPARPELRGAMGPAGQLPPPECPVRALPPGHPPIR